MTNCVGTDRSTSAHRSNPTGCAPRRKPKASSRPLSAEKSLSLNGPTATSAATTSPCEVRLLALELGGKRLIRGSIIDISRRKAAEARIRQLTRTYALLSEVNKAIVRESDTATLLQSICRIAVEQGGFRLAWVALASGDGSVRPAARSAVDSDTLGLIPRFIGESGPACPIIREALETSTYAIAPDLLNDPRAASWREAATTTGCRAMAAFPIIVNGRVRGTFNLYAESAAAFSDDERALLDELARDISFGLEVGERERARQRAETALRNSEERFREIAETIDDVFWVTDIRRTRFLYISPAFEKIWGRPLQDAHASTAVYLDAIHPDDLQKVRDAAAPDGDPAAYEVQYRIRRPDGAIRWILEKGYPTRDRSGAFSRVIGVARDITDFRELAEQLRHSQKLEALGHLAGGIAHDFNNILTALILQKKVARSAPNLPEEVRESLDEMRHAIDQATTLTRQLLLFSRRQTPQPRPLDLNESIRQLTRMLGRLIGEDIDLRLDLHPAPLPLRADPGMIDQVLVNLAVNARDAMPDGGTLHIKTDAIELSAPEAARTPGLSPGPYARLRIRDTGCGIEPELLEHIFDPFFTTKQPGEGTGLGLATVHSIVAQHHGHITVSSRPERGTTFTILLPLDKDPASGEPPATSAPEKTGMPSGSETVLLVEDDPKVRRLTERILRRYGYTVLSAENGRQALELWAAERDRIDLLLTDIVMPAGLSGTDLAQRIREDRPDLPVLFISGYDATHAGRNRQLDPGEHFLAKPFLPENLLQSVRRCLGRSAPGR
ncbi:MAG: response regulator [Verrucomicrobia bacterium]|nr:MAG: response regulator [Verrucomicrobiota bacterium]